MSKIKELTYNNSTIELDPFFNIIVGENNSGKTSIVNMIEAPFKYPKNVVFSNYYESNLFVGKMENMLEYLIHKVDMGKINPDTQTNETYNSIKEFDNTITTEFSPLFGFKNNLVNYVRKLVVEKDLRFSEHLDFLKEHFKSLLDEFKLELKSLVYDTVYVTHINDVVITHKDGNLFLPGYSMSSTESQKMYFKFNMLINTYIKNSIMVIDNIDLNLRNKELNNFLIFLEKEAVNNNIQIILTTNSWINAETRKALDGRGIFELIKPSPISLKYQFNRIIKNVKRVVNE